ncbi:MAG: Hint domain-containing protein [Pseudomonadota bacterium]
MTDFFLENTSLNTVLGRTTFQNQGNASGFSPTSSVILPDANILMNAAKSGNLDLLLQSGRAIVITTEVRTELIQKLDKVDFTVFPDAADTVEWINVNSKRVLPNGVRAVTEWDASQLGFKLFDVYPKSSAGENSMKRFARFYGRTGGSAGALDILTLSEDTKSGVGVGQAVTGAANLGQDMVAYAGSLVSQGAITPTEFFAYIDRSAKNHNDAITDLQSAQTVRIPLFELDPELQYSFGDSKITARIVPDDNIGFLELDRSGTSRFVLNNGEIVEFNNSENYGIVYEDGPEFSIRRRVLGRRVKIELFDLDDAEIVKDPVADRFCFAAGTGVRIASGEEVPIEEISAGDFVLAFDPSEHIGPLKAKEVTQKHLNSAEHLIDVAGLRVTPGHVFLCGDGPNEGQFEPLMDILLRDGALVRDDGVHVRPSIDATVGSDADRIVHVVYRTSVKAELQEAVLRAGTRIVVKDDEVTVAEILEQAGFALTEDGYVEKEGVPKAPLHWFGKPPNPADYILAKSGLSLDELYQVVDGVTRLKSGEVVH